MKKKIFFIFIYLICCVYFVGFVFLYLFSFDFYDFLFIIFNKRGYLIFYILIMCYYLDFERNIDMIYI